MSLPRKVKDFAMLFNYLWYQNFPLTPEYKEFLGRANWTIHIGIVVRTCADLMGYFSGFEEGKRTDAIIRDNNQKGIAQVEWEWKQLLHKNVNELNKLFSENEEFEFSIFVNYISEKKLKEALNIVSNIWKKAKTPLILFIITFSKSKGERRFKDMHTYTFHRGKKRELRKQPALPWEVKGTRWESSYS